MTTLVMMAAFAVWLLSGGVAVVATLVHFPAREAGFVSVMAFMVMLAELGQL